jgi:hypothetical protein
MGVWVIVVDPQVVDEPWKIVHQSDHRSCTYNSPPASGFALAGIRQRARSKKVIDTIHQQHSASIDASRTLATLQAETLDLPIIRRDIYNERA